MHPFHCGLRTENKKCYRIHGVLEEAKLIYVEKIKTVFACGRMGAGIDGEGHDKTFSGDSVFSMLIRIWDAQGLRVT